jgi:flagellar basal body rod protein FlgF
MAPPEAKTQYLGIASYVYKEPNNTSQRTWLLQKGQELTTGPEDNGWTAISTKDGKKGFVRKEVLTPNKP